MAASTTSESILYIGPVIDEDTATLITLSALTPWVEIGEVNNLGDIGDEAAAVDAPSISRGRNRTLKGTRNGGVQGLTVNHDPLDAGQIALIAAEKTKFTYAFKLVAADAPDEDYVDTAFYYGAKVMSARVNLQGQDAVTMRAFGLAIQTATFEVPANVPTP
ncbi:MAG: hypothetical protein ACOH2M_26165 [Cypionkella sp.]